MTTLLPTSVPKLALSSTNIARHEPTNTVKQSTERPEKSPTNLQERQISTPGPNGTADTEIGPPDLRYRVTAFTMTSLSPAKSSCRMSISTNDTPPTPRSALAAGQCKRAWERDPLEQDPNRVGPGFWIPSSNRSSRQSNPLGDLHVQRPRQKGSDHSQHEQ